MFPIEGVAHVKLTAWQSARIYQDAMGDQLGYASEARSAAAKKQQQFGSQVDPVGDHGFPFGHQDIVSLTMSSNTASPSLTTRLSFAEDFTGAVNSLCSLAFDVDSNPLTGSLYNLSPGVEYAVEIHVSGQNGVYSATAVVKDLLQKTSKPLSPDPVVFRAREDNSGFLEIRTLECIIAKSAVGLDLTPATSIPVHVASLHQGVVSDQITALFAMDWWTSQPSLKVTGNCVPVPGQHYGFEVAGLSPNANFVVLLDGAQVFSGTTNATGGFSGSFSFPALPVDQYYALTARDLTSQKFGYSMTCPAP